MEFLTAEDLASYFERDVNGALQNIVDRTNALVTEQWVNAVDPAPEWVKNVAWDVAIRAGRNPKGVTSTSRAFDDVTLTDRWEAGENEGVFLTADEAAKLNGDTGTASVPAAAKTIRMRIPGWTCP